MLRLRLTIAAALAAAVPMLAVPALASAAPAHGRLHVAMSVDRFVTGARSTTARGTVTADLSQVGGHSTVLKAPITLHVAKSASCQILNLDLQQLNLVLLGLNVHLDRVLLVVTGQSRGGVLGSLFCKLAHARASAARVAAARSLNAGLRRHPLHPFGFTTSIHAAQAPAGSCPVLDLVVGPLDLNLLGLVVNLNQVHLSVTASPGQGTLGDLFCQLSK